MNTDQLKQALKALGWKQSELARRVGVGDTTVSRWVGGDAVPEPVAAYLGIALELDRLYKQFVVPPKRTRRDAGTQVAGVEKNH